jgi:hypothetical protein
MIAGNWILSEASPFQLWLHRQVRIALWAFRASNLTVASWRWKKMRVLLRT